MTSLLKIPSASFRFWPRALALAFACVLAACGRAPDDNALVVGMELAYPPFEMSDEQNQPAGISVEIAKALGEHLGRPIRIENIPFEGLIPALQTGKIDLIISSMTATPDRAKSIAFSEPYLDTGLCLLVSKNSDIRSIADADKTGKLIAVKQGTTGYLYAVDHIRNARALAFQREYAAALEVAQGKADAFIYDQMSIYQHWKRNEATTRPILEPFKRESWAIGLRLGEDDLKAQVNAFLRDFRERGGFDALGDRFLAEEKKAFQELGFPFFF